MRSIFQRVGKAPPLLEILLSTSNLIHCIYASAAAPDLSDHDLGVLLKRARAKNSILGLTGMLLHCDGSFFQVLEGPEMAVDSVYEKIANDARHIQITRIIREPIAQRQFSNWTMGFNKLSQQELGVVLETNDFFADGSSLASIGPGRAKKLLTAFQKGRWHLGEQDAVAAA
jgi:hypothetical protein